MSHIRNYWTKERCQEEALKYTNRNDFSKKSKSAYSRSLKNDWLDEICSHIIVKIKPKNYWTKERCQEEALKYLSRKNFQNNSISAYKSALKNNWLDDVCSHMKQNDWFPAGYWTKERCQEEVSKYNTRREFRINSKAYPIAVKRGWLDEICEHLPGWKPKNYWTKEKCAEEALKYEKRIDFEKNCSCGYQKAKREGWMDEISKHMIIIGNRFNRCIYVAEFSDNHAYIGLTYNYNNRIKDHMKEDRNSTVYEHYQKTGLTPIFKQLTEYIDVNDASKLEGVFVEKYKTDNWTILNRAKTGAVGSNNRIWTIEKCIEESKKYKNIKEFRTKASGAYNAYIKFKLNILVDHKQVFIEKSKKIHDDRYDYSDIIYINISTKINIKCKICGSTFEQIPCNHYRLKTNICNCKK